MRAIEFKKFDGVGMETSFAKIKDEINTSERVELFISEKIIKLNIRFGELFHKCNEREWSEFYNFLANKKIKIKKNK